MKNAAGISTVGYDCVFLTLSGAANVELLFLNLACFYLIEQRGTSPVLNEHEGRCLPASVSFF